MIKKFKSILRQYILNQVPDLRFYKTVKTNVELGKHVKLYSPVRLSNVKIGDYSYVSGYTFMQNVKIGKFCSIGPRCFFGWGIHPIDGISTAPMFYSLGNQNGMTLSKEDKIIEHKEIVIGHDVFIGMNVTILDGVTIGNGAVIGAGAVVSKNIPPYSVAIGNPIKIIKYRFPEEVCLELEKMCWWDFPEEQLLQVEKYFFDVEEFIKKSKKNCK